MPLGDPHGANFEYTQEGLPEGVFAFTVPVSDIDRSLGFYRDLLGMTVLGQDDGHAYLIRGACRIVLERSENVGIDTGVYISVDSPYNTHRRLVDEGVGFWSEPRRGPMGTFTAILDPDRNVLRMIETGAEFRLRTIS